MYWKTLPLVALACAPVLFALTPQKRASEKKQPTYEERVASANKAWAAKHYGTCASELQEALNLARKHHRTAVKAAMPVPPAPWTLVENKNEDRDAATLNAMFGGGANMVPLEMEYKNPETNERMTLSVMIKTPMIQQYSMMFTNPAFLDKDSELIEYTSDKGVLKNQGRRTELDVVLDGESLFSAKIRSEKKGDFLLEVVNQAAVDKVKAAIKL